MTNLDIVAEFVMDIIEGKYTLSEVQARIKTYEEQYGSDFFADYEVNQKEKPWDASYLNELRLKSMTGMTSKQFILHLAEVSEYVHSREKSIAKKQKCILITGIVTISVLIALIVILFAMR